MWPTLIPLLGGLFDKLFPDPSAAADAKLKLMQLAQAGDLAQLDADMKMAIAQTDVNKAEASSGNSFASSWRPFVGWTCGMALAFKFILGPAAVVLMAMAGHPIVLPDFDFTEMNTILLGMLGLGSLRTVEKIRGVA